MQSHLFKTNTFHILSISGYIVLPCFLFFLVLRRCEELEADCGVEPLPGGHHHELLPQQHGQLPQPQHLRVSLQRFHQVSFSFVFGKSP